MDTGKPPYNIWLIIVVTSIVPTLLFIFIFTKWYFERSTCKTKLNLFILRQNEVLSQDAVSISKTIRDLLDGAAKDIKTLSLIELTSSALKTFYRCHIKEATLINSETENITKATIPLYNEMVYMDNNGNEIIKLINGKNSKNLLKNDECFSKNLCDKKSRKLALNLKPNKIFFGNLMRYYVPKNEKEPYLGKYTIYYKVNSGLYELGLDYRHFVSILFLPSFPYYSKSDLLFAYDNGNYIYILDSKNEFIAHPKHWHIYGIDKKSGNIALPMIQDEDEGFKRLNITLYKGKKLKKYFYRLLNESLVKKDIDIFRASNLKGKNHVYTVAPIFVNEGQFNKTAPWGHVVIGCSIEFFEEPTKVVPTYY